MLLIRFDSLQQMYRRGEGVEKDEAKSAAYKEKVLEYQEQINKQTQLEFQQGT